MRPGGNRHVTTATIKQSVLFSYSARSLWLQRNCLFHFRYDNRASLHLKALRVIGSIHWALIRGTNGRSLTSCDVEDDDEHHGHRAQHDGNESWKSQSDHGQKHYHDEIAKEQVLCLVGPLECLP